MAKNKNQRLWHLKQRMSKKKPSFKRIESWRYKRVHGGWRAAKGIDSKTRQKLKSGVKSPNVGYRTPKKVRGLHPSGKKEITISNLKEIEGLSPRQYAVKIASKVGSRKKRILMEELRSKKFVILNSGMSYNELLKMKDINALPISLEED